MITINVIATTELAPAQDDINQAGDIACYTLPIYIPDHIVIAAARRKEKLPDEMLYGGMGLMKPCEWRLTAPHNGHPYLSRTLWTDSGRRSKQCWQGMQYAVAVPGYTYRQMSAGGYAYWAWIKD